MVRAQPALNLHSLCSHSALTLALFLSHQPSLAAHFTHTHARFACRYAYAGTIGALLVLSCAWFVQIWCGVVNAWYPGTYVKDKLAKKYE